MRSKENINCLILEDEFYTAREIMRLLKEYDGNYNVTHILESCQEFTHYMEIGELPDLIICSVTLADGSIFKTPAFSYNTAPLILTCVEESISDHTLPNLVGTIIKPITAGLLFKYLRLYEHRYSHLINH